MSVRDGGSANCCGSLERGWASAGAPPPDNRAFFRYE